MISNLFKDVDFGIDDSILKKAGAGEGTIKDNMDDLCNILEEEIAKNKASAEEKKDMLERLRTFRNTETNIMLVGPPAAVNVQQSMHYLPVEKRGKLQTHLT